MGHFLNTKSQKLSIKRPKTPREKSVFMTTTRFVFFLVLFFFFLRIQSNFSMGLVEWQDHRFGAKQNDLVSNAGSIMTAYILGYVKEVTGVLVP